MTMCAAGPTAADTRIIAVTKAAASEAAVWRVELRLNMIFSLLAHPEAGDVILIAGGVPIGKRRVFSVIAPKARLGVGEISQENW